MSKKIQAKKEAKAKAVKAPGAKLLSYTLKAVIPTGQYANIQPEITVQAATLEQAERFAMPYIETLFARYREAGVMPVQPPMRPVATPQNTPVASKTPAPAAPTAPASKAPVTAAPAPVKAPMGIAGDANPNRTYDTAKAEGESMIKNTLQAIVMTVPFSRAKQALESCTSLAALKLVSDQVEKSTKLVDAEKAELRKMSEAKLETLNVKA